MPCGRPSSTRWCIGTTAGAGNASGSLSLRRGSGQRFDDRIEVYSPGTLPPGVSLKKMRRLEPQSVLRNPIIVGVLRDLGSRYIERLGTGIRRMALAMQEHGLPRPRFDEVGSEFRVTLMGPGERFMEDVTTRPAWAEGLGERQIEAVLYVGEEETLRRIVEAYTC